jgi:hypothetical protein
MARPEDPRFQHAIAEAKKVERQLSNLAPTLSAMLTTCQSAYPSNEKAYWSTKLRRDCAERMIILCAEMNSVSTLNLLAVCRYAHELGIWLILASKDERINLLYGRILLDSHIEHSEGIIRQLEVEIRTYDELAQREEDGLKQAIARAAERRKLYPEADIARDLTEDIDRVKSEVDWRHWSAFLLYRRQAATHGYRFQADRLRSIAVPEAKAELADHKHEADEFRERWPNLLHDFGYKKDKDFRWNWKERADDAGLTQEHDFL